MRPSKFRSMDRTRTYDAFGRLATEVQVVATGRSLQTSYGWDGNDRSTGLGGFDNFNADDGDDAFDGGSGEDLVYYDFAPGPVTVDLAAGRSRGHGADALVSIEDVYGSKFADRITGNAGPNWLHGYNGADVVSGGGGADQVFGDRGDDVLLGGAAADRLSGGPGRDRLNGGAGRDRCTGEKKQSCP